MQLGLDIPIIFITGFGNVPQSVRAMKAGAVDFLQKLVPASGPSTLSTGRSIATARAPQPGQAPRDRGTDRDAHTARMRGLRSGGRLASRTSRSPTSSASAKKTVKKTAPCWRHAEDARSDLRRPVERLNSEAEDAQVKNHASRNAESATDPAHRSFPA